MPHNVADALREWRAAEQRLTAAVYGSRAWQEGLVDVEVTRRAYHTEAERAWDEAALDTLPRS